ncbi:MAG: hypothetical protein F4196_01515 [Acidimicrobiia bacterium]|nr:hypothetical protein [Acidimicrobiia bacterium]
MNEKTKGTGWIVIGAALLAVGAVIACSPIITLAMAIATIDTGISGGGDALVIVGGGLMWIGGAVAGIGIADRAASKVRIRHGSDSASGSAGEVAEKARETIVAERREAERQQKIQTLRARLEELEGEQNT